jgi:hypothetical protein
MALSPSLEIPEHYRREFAENWDHNVNQEIQRLGNRVRVDNWAGKSKVYNDIDEVEWTERTGRLTNSTLTEVTGKAREAVKRDFKCQVVFDQVDDDFLGMLGQPDSEVQEEMRRAWNRKVDTLVALACDQTEYGGAESYTDAIDLPSSQQVGVQFGESPAANIGMTPSKLEEAVRILETYDIFCDEEEIAVAMGPAEKRDLLQYLKTATNEVWANMIGAWHEGKEKKLYGMDVIITNRLQHSSSTDIATCFVYSKERGLIVVPDDMKIKFDERADLDHAIQISAYSKYCVLRRFEKTVVTIACDRSP